MLRQWSTFHPEFTFLPRKFKIAVTAAPADRAAIRAHDIGIQVVRNADGDVGYQIIIGGGLGRTPIIGQVLSDYVSHKDLLPYLTAVMRVYNRYGRRDNKYKARIKILVQEEGLDKIRGEVAEEFRKLDADAIAVTRHELDRITAYFAPPAYEDRPKY